MFALTVKVKKESSQSLRERAEKAAAEAARLEAEATAARDAAVSALADGDETSAEKHRCEMGKLRDQAETQHLLADELQRRADAAERREMIDAAIAARDRAEKVAARAAAEIKKRYPALVAELRALRLLEKEAREAIEAYGRAVCLLYERGIAVEPLGTVQPPIDRLGWGIAVGVLEALHLPAPPAEPGT